MYMKYKVKNCFVMKDVVGDKIVLARGPISLDFNGILILNESCAFIWNYMNNYITSERLAILLTEKYGISFETALKDINTCISKMIEYDILEIIE